MNRLKQTGEDGARKKTNNKWFEIQDSISYWEDFYSPKIVWGNLNLAATYSIVESGMYINAPCPMIVPANKFLLAVLNSKLADYYIKSLGVARNGGYFEYKPMFIEKLPIPILSETQQLKFTKLIDDILIAKQKNESTIEMENMIDNLIFQLYELDSIEIKVVEKLTKL